MGCSIQFVRLTDFAADVDVLDFSTAGYSLAVDGYFPVAAPLGARSVREVITLKLQGTSKDDLAAMTQEIDEKIKQVQWWIDTPTVERYQVWIRVQLENETYPRQAQILNIQPPDKIRLFTPEERLDNYIGSYSIGIERTPFWEDSYPYPTTTDLTGLCPLGGMSILSETINGDVPARLAKLTILESDNRVGLTDFWYGFRTNRLGTASNFVPIWQISLGQILSDTTIVADATAYNGGKFRCNFSTSTSLVSRCYVLVGSVVSVNQIPDQRGTFLVLLRARMTDNTSVARVRIGTTALYNISTTPEALTYCSRVTIQNISSQNNWKLYEMGTVKIPSIKIPIGTALNNFGIIIDAERISGSGSLDLDSFIMIPVDEGAIKSWSNAISNSTQSLTTLQYAAQGEQSYIVASGDNTIRMVGFVNPRNYALPANSEAPYIVIAADRRIATGTAQPAYADANITVSYTYIPRWRTLRGNST